MILERKRQSYFRKMISILYSYNDGNVMDGYNRNKFRFVTKHILIKVDKISYSFQIQFQILLKIYYHRSTKILEVKKKKINFKKIHRITSHKIF